MKDIITSVYTFAEVMRELTPKLIQPRNSLRLPEQTHTGSIRSCNVKAAKKNFFLYSSFNIAWKLSNKFLKSATWMSDCDSKRSPIVSSLGCPHPHLCAEISKTSQLNQSLPNHMEKTIDLCPKRKSSFPWFKLVGRYKSNHKDMH